MATDYDPTDDLQPAAIIAQNEQALSRTLGELRAQIPHAVQASEALAAGTIREQSPEALAQMLEALRGFAVLRAIVDEMDAADTTQIMPHWQIHRIEAVLAGQPDPVATLTRLPTPADR